ncbi:MAG: OmpA family protein [Saprospiraceae bacterium]
MMMKGLFLVLLCPALSFIQPTPKAIKLYQKAQKELQNNKPDKAIEYLQSAIDLDPAYKDAHLALYTIYLAKNEIDPALKHIGLAANAGDRDQARLFFNGGKIAFQYGKYTESKQFLNSYLKLNSKDTLTRSTAIHIQESNDYALSHIKDVKPFAPVFLKSINTSMPEYLPSIDASGHHLVFTRRIQGQEDLFIANGEDTTWNSIVPWPQNTLENEGAHVISADGKTIVFTRCDGKDGMGSCDLYISEFKNTSWTKPVNIGAPVNSTYWESQPSLSANGRTLYFVSNRPGGKGGYDIWISFKTGKTWSRPMNAGNTINSSWDELSPYIHPDGSHLYFRSNGWPGFGSFDLFVSIKNELNHLEKPINLGFPINDYKDQGAMTVDLTGSRAYLTIQSVDNNNALVSSDIVSFNLYKEVSSSPCIFIQGKIKDVGTESPIPGAKIVFSSELHPNRNDSITSDQEGEYLIVLPRQDKVQLYCVAESFNFYSDRILIDSVSNSRIHYDIGLSRVTDAPAMNLAKPIVLKNVLYEYASATLLKESFTELDKLIEYLNANPLIKMDIMGHTDNTGNAMTNLTLSKQRAKSVYDYFLSKNINQARMTYQGFGDTKPIMANDSEINKSLNRRVEIKLSK